MRGWSKEIVGKGEMEQVLGGASGDLVHRVVLPSDKFCFLKVATGDRRKELRREHAVLSWLDGRAGAPLVEAYWEEDEESYLVTSGMSGRPVSEGITVRPVGPLLSELARSLREVHSLPIAACPFERNLGTTVAEAHRQAGEGAVDLTNLDMVRRGWSLDQLLSELDRSLPHTEERAFTHGDFSLTNVLLKEGRVTGVVDWGGAGLADPYRDVALLLRGLARNYRMNSTTCSAQATGSQNLIEAGFDSTNCWTNSFDHACLRRSMLRLKVATRINSQRRSRPHDWCLGI